MKAGIITNFPITSKRKDRFMKKHAKIDTSVAPRTPEEEKRIIRQISFVGILGNILLSSFKLFAGIYGNSSAMVSDAVHSMSDVFATFIAMLGVKLSKRTADENHPYGHERLECLASLLLGVLLLVTGIGIGKVGLSNIFSGDYKNLTPPATIALVAAIVSIVTKEAMYWYTRYYAKLLNSSAFLADAWHHRSDAFSSIGSLVGIGGAMLGYPVLDSVASVVICLFILKVAYDILKTAVNNMLDTSCGEEYDRKLKSFITEQEGVVCVDMLRSRSFGNMVYVDLEMEVDGDIPLRQAHAIAERVHADVEAHFPEVKHIMIHINPAE